MKINLNYKFTLDVSGKATLTKNGKELIFTQIDRTSSTHLTGNSELYGTIAVKLSTGEVIKNNQVIFNF